MFAEQEHVESLRGGHAECGGQPVRVEGKDEGAEHRHPEHGEPAQHTEDGAGVQEGHPAEGLRRGGGDGRAHRGEPGQEERAVHQVRGPWPFIVILSLSLLTTTATKTP